MTEDLNWLYDKAGFELNSKQKNFLSSFINGTGHFSLCGLAGSGKSTVMELLKEYYADEVVFFASSGVANLALPSGIGDGTGHSGLSLPTALSTEMDIKKVSKKFSELFVKSDLVKVVVIDECYGYNSDTLDMIWRRFERVNKKSKKRSRRNIRLLLVGDPAQQITITDSELKKGLKERWGSHLMFDSTVWSRFKFTYCVFDKVERQSDHIFKACLDVIRYAQEERYPKCLAWLNKKVDRNYTSDKLVLAATNKTASRINNEVLNRNPNPNVTFTGRISGKFDMRNVLVDKQITVCLGLRIMTTVNDNIEGKFVNGSQGVVTEIIEGYGIQVLFDNGESHFLEYHLWENKETYVEVDVVQADGSLKDVLKERTLGKLQALNCIPSACITISKSQGLTITTPFVIDPEATWLYTSKKLEDFGTNFLYVSTSRGASIDLITLARPIEPDHIKPCYSSINYWHRCVELSVI